MKSWIPLFIYTLLIVAFTTEPIYAGEMGLVSTLASPGEQRGGSFGSPVTTINDLNGDGNNEFMIAAVGESLLTEPRYSGHVYVLDGSTMRTLHILTSPNPQEFGHFGVGLSAIDDITGDGIADILASTPWENPDTSQLYAGRAYAFSGCDGSLIHEMASPTDTSSGLFGMNITGISDIDGDTWPDIIVSAHQENPFPQYLRSGAVHLFSGISGNHIRWIISPNIALGSGFGHSIATISDLNDDGIEDIIIGAPYEDGDVSSYAGRAYVISGADDQTLLSLLSPVEQLEELFGWSVAALGDVNDDTIPDIIVGAPEISEDSSIRYAEGSAYVFSGSNGQCIRTLTSPNPQSEGHFGNRVKCCDDMDNDGVSDIIVCADSEDSGAGMTSGRLYIFSGATGSLIYTVISPNAESNSHFGIDAICTGNEDGDGRLELLVGAPYEDPGLSPLGCGRVYVFTQGLKLSCSLEEDELTLSWTPIVAASGYWLYGSQNEPFFIPGLEPPYIHRIAVLSPGFDSIIRSDGIDDPMFNWTYQLIAVDRLGHDLEMSNRIGEFDFAYNPPTDNRP